MKKRSPGRQGRLVFVPSFAPDLVTGVATWALELFRGAPALDALYVPIGLGSGICGAILRARPARSARPRSSACRAAVQTAYARSFAAGQLVTLKPSGDNGRRHGGPPAGSRGAGDHPCRRRTIVTVTDEQIASAIRAYWTDTHNLVEGAGAAPLAALIQERVRMQGSRVGVVVSGGNIDLDLFQRWVLGHTDGSSPSDRGRRAPALLPPADLPGAWAEL